MDKLRPDRESLQAALKRLFPRGAVEVGQCEAAGNGRPDCEASVSLGNENLSLLVEFKQLGSGARLKEAAELIRRRQDEHPSHLWILACPFLSPARQELLRESGVSFFDFAGNAWIVSDAVHVDRRGFPNPFSEQRTRDPFSDKASLVLRALIASGPGRGVRNIADQAGLSPGYVSKVVQELEERGYVARREEGLALQNAQELLQDWVSAYRKHWIERREYFLQVPRAEAVMDAMRQASLGDEYALALQAGASLILPYAEFDVVDVYVHNIDAAVGLAGQLDAREVNRGANLRVSVPYYRVSAFFDRQKAAGLPVVSDLQLYLDLYDYPLRGREQAERILERRLIPKLETAEGE
ncbi:MAG: type IV toxin-antitoxin system AbiEi family antitoxin [Thermoleophilia bacterium]